MPVADTDKRLPNRQKRDHLRWVMTARFIEEVHRIEEAGRSQDRKSLEHLLLLPYGAVTAMRAGRTQVGALEIALLKKEFNGDFQYVLLGIRDVKLSGDYRGGRNMAVHRGYTFGYQGAAPPNLLTLAGLPSSNSAATLSGTADAPAGAD